MKALVRKFHSQIVTINAARDKAVTKLAAEARKTILPDFKRRGWTYVQGMGRWLVRDASGEAIADSDLPKEIYELLVLEVGPDDELALYIKDIT